MNDLEIQKWLRKRSDNLQSFNNYNLAKELQESFGIKAKAHSNIPNLLLFKYDMVKSPMSERIVRECRGIILDVENNFDVISRSFDKFFNSGEGYAATIDWATAKVLEKVDGSLLTLYPYNGSWHVATTGTPDASGEVSGFGFSFAQLFWETLTKYTSKLPDPSCRKCFMFELTSPYNKVVVKHSTSSLTMLGGRDLVSQKELNPHQALEAFESKITLPGFSTIFPLVKEFNLKSAHEVKQSFDNFAGIEQEGYVVVDANFNRIKDKHPQYLALHHMLSGMSQRAFIEIVRTGEISEVLNAFPEFSTQIIDMKSKYDCLVSEVESDFQQLKDIQDQKTFAMAAVLTKCSSALFSVRAKKSVSIASHLQKMQVDSILKLIGYKADKDVIPSNWVD